MNPDNIINHDEVVMGTVASFTLYRQSSHLSYSQAMSGLQAACAKLHFLDEIFSTWKPDSPMSRLRRKELEVNEAPSEIQEVLRLCESVKESTKGWFDPWAMPGGVDPTGLVKGWAVERALEILQDSGISAALINAGGDLAVFGRPETDLGWRIGIQHPWRSDMLACVVQVESAVATSGTYERGAHIIDPFTGLASIRVESATVTGPNLALADAFATALAASGSDGLAFLENFPHYDAYLIYLDGSEFSTPGIKLVT